MIIEWSNVQRYGGSWFIPKGTFQAILDLNSGPDLGGITFNYVNSRLDVSYLPNADQDATVGIKNAGGQGNQRLLVSYAASPSPWIGNGQAIRFESAGTTTNATNADFNNDGRVDAADYTVWRNTLGQSGLTPFSGADGDGDGAITQADYSVWKSHFGEVITPGAGSVASAEIAVGQSPATESAAAAFAFVEPAIQIGKTVEQTPAATTSTPVEPEVEVDSAASFARFDTRFAPHDYAFRPRARVNSFRVAAPVLNNLLLLLANDRVGRPSRQDFTAANDRKNDDQCEDGLDGQSLTDEPLAVALAEWGRA